MKKFNYLFIALLSAVLLVGCKSEKKNTETGENPNLIRPEFVVTKEDTTQVRRLTRQYLNLLENSDLDGALSMLRYYEHDSIKPLPRQLYAKERMVLGMFLGMKTEVDHIIFFRPDDSEVKYTVTMFERTDENDRRPNKASFLIRPVRKHGEWFLTLADKQTDQVKSKIKH